MRMDTPPHNSMEDNLEEIEDGDIMYMNDDDDDDDDFHGIPDEELNDVDHTPDDYEPFLREPERDDAIFTFKKHTAAVFCCSIHPQRNICATGGEDDKAYVWDATTGEVIHEINNHKDTVIAAYFSYDGNYLATGDMAGEIQVFKLANDFKKVWDYSMGDMCWLQWHTASNVLMAGADTGEIYIWRIPSGDCKVLPGKGHRCETADLASDGKKLFAGYGNGTIKLWDIKNCSVIVEINSNDPIGHHTECVSSVSCDSDKSLYLSGSEDGSILLISNSGPVCTLNQSAGPIEAVAFCPDGDVKIAATGTLHGKISIWDISKQNLRTICEHPDSDPNNEDGITTIKWLPQQTLVCGTLNGNIHSFDGRSGAHKFSLLGHAAEIYELSYNHREGIMLSASEDSTAKIFKVNL